MATPGYGVATERDKALLMYKTMRVETASPGELVLMLYNELLRSMREALDAIDRRDAGCSCKNLLKAQDILLELRSSLNMAQGKNVAANLDSVYGFVGDRLVEANVKKAKEPLEDAIKVMSSIRDGWQEVLGKHV